MALDEEESSVDVHPSVTTSWIGPRTVGLPYTADFTAGGHPSFAIWDIIDGNNDGQTWVFDMESYYSKCVKLQGYSVKDGLYEYNDYLLTPTSICFPQLFGDCLCYRAVLRAIRSISTSARSRPVSSTPIKRNGRLPKQCNVGGYSAVDCTFDFTVTEAGKYQVVVAADELFTTSHYSHLQLKKFAIKAVVALPGSCYRCCRYSRCRLRSRGYSKLEEPYRDFACRRFACRGRYCKGCRVPQRC